MSISLTRIATAIALLCCLFAVGGCGQKGDLYLPDQSGLHDDSYRQHS